MRDQHGDAAQWVSRRDVAAAWIICCALAIVAAALVVVGPTGESRNRAYVGTYLPGRDVVRGLDRRDDDFDDEVERVMSAPDLTQPLFCSAHDDPLHGAAAASPDNTTPPLKC
jgi:hypothetical protein